MDWNDCARCGHRPAIEVYSNHDDDDVVVLRPGRFVRARTHLAIGRVLHRVNSLVRSPVAEVRDRETVLMYLYLCFKSVMTRSVLFLRRRIKIVRKTLEQPIFAAAKVAGN